MEEEGSVERLVAGGSGLVRRDGGVCFVRGALPGERIRYRLTGKRRGAPTGELTEVLLRSGDRIEPPCPYYDRCGGCELQELDYGAQLASKEEILREQLRRIGGFSEPAVAPIRYGEPYGYRTRLRLHRAPAGGWGFRERGSRRIVGVRRCIVATERLNRELTNLTEAAPEVEEVQLAEGEHAVLRSDRGESGSVSLLGEGVEFAAAGFFQGNLPLFEKLLAEIVELARPAEGYELYDLYAGTGAIAAVVAGALKNRKACSPRLIHCVEPAESSCRYISPNLSGLPHRVYPMPVEQFIRSEPPPGAGALLVVDPPRAGLSPKVRRWLLEARPGQLFYVSCDPATLARDLRELSEVYRFREVRPFDFFPQTSHIESLTLLEPR